MAKAGSKKSKKKQSVDEPKGQQGRRFTDDQRAHALALIAGGMERVAVAKAIGTTTESLRRWVAEATRKGTKPAATKPVTTTTTTEAADASRASRPRSPYAPSDPGQGLGEHEVAAILEVLRLVLVDGAMELRFCGARVRLGRVES